MAAEFLRGHGVDLQKEISKVQFGQASEASSISNLTIPRPPRQPISKIQGVRLPSKPPNSLWDVILNEKRIHSISPHAPSLVSRFCPPDVMDGREQFLAPSLCHPHIHLDKCFLLSDPKYSDLEIIKGDFVEALELTGKAKSRFQEDDLLRRGRWLVTESIAAGVTSIRAFVEVDATVRFKCLDVGLKLKKEFKDRCEIQICVFAQDPVMTTGKNPEGQKLIEEALGRKGVDVVGSTPYVEGDEYKMRENITWAISTALKYGKHLDFHLDYNLDPNQKALTEYVIERLKAQHWIAYTRDKTIVLGHCTRLTMFTADQWHQLRTNLADLPISFIGLPTSDIFMMDKPSPQEGGGQRVRGTLQIPSMIQKYNLQGAISVNNVGNAFTPQGSCDPMAIASMGVGLYQAGTKRDTELLFECVSTRAKAAIGNARSELGLKEGDYADFVLFGAKKVGDETYLGKPRGRNTIQEIIYDPPHERRTVYRGCLIAF